MLSSVKQIRVSKTIAPIHLTIFCTISRHHY